MSGNVISVTDAMFGESARYRRKIAYDAPHFSDRCPCGHTLATHTQQEDMKTTFKPGRCASKACECVQYGIGVPTPDPEEEPKKE